MRHLRRLGHCLGAGVVAGAALLPLQLLLWPELQAPPGRLFLFAMLWLSWAAMWLGGVAFLLCELAALRAPYLAARRGLSVGLWRWLTAGVGLLVTAVAWWNYRNTKDLLLSSRRASLEEAVGVAALFTLLALALAFTRRPRRRPLLLPGVATAALLGWLWNLWWASPPLDTHPPGSPPAVVGGVRRPVLVAVWEGADLGVLLPALERGDLPFLKSLWGEGSWGQLRTLRPYSRTAALTTLLTGCLPSTHGIAGRRVYRLEWLQPQPFTLLLQGPWPTPHQLPWRLWERAAAPPPRNAPLWHILEGSGRRAGVAGWYAPARASWVVPRVLAAEASPLAEQDGTLSAALAPALERSPDLAARTQEAFAVASHEFRSTLARLRAEPVEALVVVSDLPGRLRPLWTNPPGNPLRGEVLRLALGLLDEQLAQLWRTLGGEEVLLVLASPYGMAPPEPWVRLQQAFRGSRRWQVVPSSRADGFVFFAGPEVRRGARVSGARLPDVTPTLLYLLDLPLARDMSGRVLLEAVPEELAASRPLRLISSYPNPDRQR